MTKILLVEDNQLNREMFSRRLERKGFQIISAGDGKEALEIADAHLPDLILMDLSLPVMDGWTATRHLKASPKTAHIPVIALTAHAMVGDREKALQAGCDDYDTKPVDLPGLLSKIKRLLPVPGESPRGSVQSALRPGSGDTMIAQGAASTYTEDQRSILVVDDNPMNREMLLRRLQREGYAVTVAGSGSEAVEWLERRAFDLVLLDMMMPEMDGLEILSIIRARFSLVELPVIVVTAKDESDDMVEALQLGANDYVTKPFNFPVLLARVQTQLALQRSRGHSPEVASPSRQRVFAQGSSNGSGSGLQRTILPGSDRGSGAAPMTPMPASSQGNGPRSGMGETVRLAAFQAGSEQGTVVEGDSSPGVSPHGALFADYEVIEEIGRGGMGVVYKARHKRMNRLVALKVINKEHLSRSSAIQRFYREIEAAAQLSHRNIVLAYDAGQVGDTHFFAMEFVEGIDLQQMVEERGPLPVEEARGYILQATRGLQHVYERSMVHRDIKPSNLLVTWDSTSGGSMVERIHRPSFNPGRTTVKILDLGLALLYDPTEDSDRSTGLTRDGRVVGTADYMAPEQWMNAHKVDIRADMYSLGVTFYFLISGKVPFPGDEPMEKMLKHHLDEPIPIQDLVSNVPPVVSEVIRRLMSKKADQRFQTPAELAEMLA